MLGFHADENPYGTRIRGPLTTRKLSVDRTVIGWPILDLSGRPSDTAAPGASSAATLIPFSEPCLPRMAGFSWVYLRFWSSLASRKRGPRGLTWVIGHRFGAEAEPGSSRRPVTSVIAQPTRGVRLDTLIELTLVKSAGH